jgi:hypothetical protein
LSAAPLAARAQSTFIWTNNAGGNASGSWGVPANWNGGAGPVADGAGNVANFGTLNINTISTVTLDGDRTIGRLVFADVGDTVAGSWVLAPGAPATSKLTLTSPLGAPTISISPGPVAANVR